MQDGCEPRIPSRIPEPIRAREQHYLLVWYVLKKDILTQIPYFSLQRIILSKYFDQHFYI